MIVYHLIDLLSQGYRLPTPDNCPQEVSHSREPPLAALLRSYQPLTSSSVKPAQIYTTLVSLLLQWRVEGRCDHEAEDISWKTTISISISSSQLSALTMDFKNVIQFNFFFMVPLCLLLPSDLQHHVRVLERRPQAAAHLQSLTPQSRVHQRNQARMSPHVQHLGQQPWIFLFLIHTIRSWTICLHQIMYRKGLPKLAQYKPNKYMYICGFTMVTP